MAQIRIELKDVYGRTNAYPRCPQAATFAQIAETKTLTARVLRHVLRLGFDVVILDRFGNESMTVPHHLATPVAGLPAPLSAVA